VAQRLVVTVSCVIFWFLSAGAASDHALAPWLLTLLALLACAEKLCSVLNIVSVEKDWVMPSSLHEGFLSALNNVCRSLLSLRGISRCSKVRFSPMAELRPSLLISVALNAQMRRIDLICKLAGPLAIALVDSVSTRAAIVVNLSMNVASVPVEYLTIAKVYRMVPDLQHPKSCRREEEEQSSSHSQYLPSNVTLMVHSFFRQLAFYCRHRSFLPSFAGALLYLTVLSFAGHMVTYLLSMGYTSFDVSIARTVSVAFEISATWLGPLMMARIGPIRSGIWFISWQMCCLTGAVAVLWFINSRTLAAAGLTIGTILSRVGLWGFDLSVQAIVQEVRKPLWCYNGLLRETYHLLFLFCRRSSRPTEEASLLSRPLGRTSLS
jgi:iron-regulated transporter 1